MSEGARVSGSAAVSGNAKLSGNSWVSGQADISDDAVVSGDSAIGGDAHVLKEDHVVTLTEPEDGVVWTAYRTRHGGRQIMRGHTLVEESEAPAGLIKASDKAWSPKS